MNTKAIIGVNILAVVLIVLGSQANVVGYQTVQSSVKERLNEKDLLFQTICDLANNQEVQKAILESQCKFQNPFPTTQLTSFPTITKRQLNIIYNLGLVLTKTVSKTKLQSIIKLHPFSALLKSEFDGVLNTNTTLNEEVQQISSLNCLCCNSVGASDNICTVLILIFGICALLMAPLEAIGNMPILYTIGLLILWPIWVIGAITLILMIHFDCFNPY
jgi:hypothetical protein